ncbi:hypothetical protein BJ508DRAFT_362304 [Ascobolus immersus RN42]|uniref:Uncharacterized protein n=1 Tax=Ascobolus immersus RN42 TaxID=1160509 RepID=A0A3N4IGS8_ASCIM|nr:hypothetical protein BJ508DRAFT_362304 [Ascobolus immersus RN42]
MDSALDNVQLPPDETTATSDTNTILEEESDSMAEAWPFLTFPMLVPEEHDKGTQLHTLQNNKMDTAPDSLSVDVQASENISAPEAWILTEKDSKGLCAPNPLSKRQQKKARAEALKRGKSERLSEPVDVQLGTMVLVSETCTESKRRFAQMKDQSTQTGSLRKPKVSRPYPDLDLLRREGPRHLRAYIIIVLMTLRKLERESGFKPAWTLEGIAKKLTAEDKILSELRGFPWKHGDWNCRDPECHSAWRKQYKHSTVELWCSNAQQFPYYNMLLKACDEHQNKYTAFIFALDLVLECECDSEYMVFSDWNRLEEVMDAYAVKYKEDKYEEIEDIRAVLYEKAPASLLSYQAESNDIAS